MLPQHQRAQPKTKPDGEGETGKDDTAANLASGELSRKAVVAKNATTAADGKTYQVDYFKLDASIDPLAEPPVRAGDDARPAPLAAVAVELCRAIRRTRTGFPQVMHRVCTTLPPRSCAKSMICGIIPLDAAVHPRYQGGRRAAGVDPPGAPRRTGQSLDLNLAQATAALMIFPLRPEPAARVARRLSRRLGDARRGPSVTSRPAAASS